MPAPLTDAQLATVHERNYVQAIRTGAPSRLVGATGFAWDPGLWTSVCASNGGAVAAALAALQVTGMVPLWIRSDSILCFPPREKTCQARAICAGR